MKPIAMRPLPPETKEFFMNGLLVVATLLIYTLAPEAEGINAELQGLIVAAIFFVALPLFYVRFVLKHSWQALGLTVGKYREHGLFTLFVLFIALAGFLIATTFFQNFQTFYTLPLRAEQSFIWFLAYELLLVPLIVLLYEVFFRGFLMLLWLSQKTRLWSVLLQGLTFFGLVLLTGSLSWNTAPLIYFSFFAGLIAYRSRSLLYSFLAQWLFLLIVDVYFLVIR